MDPKLATEVSVSDLFDQFIEASTMRNVLSIHHRILNYADLDPCDFNEFFPRLKRAVLTSRQRKNWRAKALFSKIDKRAAQRCYSNNKTTAASNTQFSDKQQVDSTSSHAPTSLSSMQSIKSQINATNNNALQSYHCLVIGSGPAGLRTAIELQLLGASKVVIVEKRSRFSRNNVLHLWPFVIDDLKSLGAKKFYGKFCAGSIDHISIRQLQLILLKVCLMIGCDFRDSCSYLSLCPASIRQPLNSIDTNDLVNVSDIKDSKSSSDNKTEEEEKAVINCELYKFDPNEEGYKRVSSNLAEIDTHRDNDRTAHEVGNEAHKGENRNDPTEVKINYPSAQPSSLKSSSPTRQMQLSRPLRLRGAHAHFECESRLNECQLHEQEWDFIIGADGRRNTLSKFFPRKEFRGRLAIAITANFINRQTTAETSVPEISGLSFIYNQDMFNALACDTNIQLENICYYKDDTHYFVMTAKKKSLLERGVLITDHPVTQDLLSDSNVNREALLKYARDAAYWTTGLEPLDFALNHYGQEDCAMFDFTSMYAASNACKAIRTQEGGLALVSLVGDSLLEPFWPTGSGCARGFLSSLDAAWMCRQWAVNRCPVIDHHHAMSLSKPSKSRCSSSNQRVDGSQLEEPTTYNRMALSVMAERESIYRILAQTTSENLQQNYSHWTLNPHTRYPNLNRHLVMPSQVEHLITDHELKCNIENTVTNSRCSTSRGRRSKSPNSLSPRKSPKKLKSANASPLAEPKNGRNRSKSLSRQQLKSKSRNDLSYEDETRFEFEQSYRNLVNDSQRKTNGMPTQYLSHHRTDCDDLDDLFKPSLSGTLPSSNNLLNLEAGRARDIDECLRQRRQKSKINFVREHLIGQLRGHSVDIADGQCFSKNYSSGGGNVALFNELKRLREQRSRGATARPESKPRDCGPLTLLASMRRCASFAERVKSFESKLSINGANHEPQIQGSSNSSATSTPRTPLIDNVKNLPQFATLQELFINNSTLTNDAARKSKIPVTKLSKDDWNVKCWENRLANSRRPADPGASRSAQFGGSARNLVKAMSVDGGSSCRSFLPTPKKQVEVFQDRIKEMAEKLKVSKETNKLYQDDQKENSAIGRHGLENSNGKGARTQGWISHLKRELVKGNMSSHSRQPMNPVVPNKPIKKLFEDDDDEDDGIDVNKHYDHLCINRPINKYLSKGSAYTSHLTRTRYDKATSKVVNSRQAARVSSNAASKHDYANTTPTVKRDTSTTNTSPSRGSSTSSARSDYSTNTTGNSSLGGSSVVGQKRSSMSVIDVECCRCQRFINPLEKITIGQSILHRNCLSCARCGITLRSNELLYYLNLLKRSTSSSSVAETTASGNPEKAPAVKSAGHGSSFTCTICEPSIRVAMNGSDRFSDSEQQQKTFNGNINLANKQQCVDVAQSRLQSREKFFSSRIDYHELYKKILSPPSSLSSNNESSLVKQKLSDPEFVEPRGGISCKQADGQSITSNNAQKPNHSDQGGAALALVETDDDGARRTSASTLTNPSLRAISAAPTAATTTNTNNNATISCSNSDGSNSERLITPSPIQVTLPLKIISDVDASLEPLAHGGMKLVGQSGSPNANNDPWRADRSSSATKGADYRIAHSETIDGSEQVTLVLPIDGRPVSAMAEPIDPPKRNLGRRAMIDEDELERFHHLDSAKKSGKLAIELNNDVTKEDHHDGGAGTDDEIPSSVSSASEDDDFVSTRTSAESDDCDGVQERRQKSADASDGSSSLSSPPSDEEEEFVDRSDDEDGAEQNSTYDDLVTSEEFEATGEGAGGSNETSELDEGGNRGETGSYASRASNDIEPAAHLLEPLERATTNKLCS